MEDVSRKVFAGHGVHVLPWKTCPLGQADMQATELGAEVWPSRQGKQELAPAAEVYVLEGQGRQVFMSAYWPAGQSSGMQAELPSVEYVPAAQSWQALKPTAPALGER